ncbi:MAG TPA: hypothetical protein VJJ52_05920 [Candidatus Nanoarchaeia archaeon]|nr:hypothetical protein [Candidatus Nanoarchaeia archaeon]
MDLLGRISQSGAVKLILSPKEFLNKRSARITLEGQISAAGTGGDFSIVDACNAQDVLGTSEVINILERGGFYEEAANIGYGFLQTLDISTCLQLDKLTADYLARVRHKDGDELRKLTSRTIQNYLRSARNEPNPFLQASVAAIIAVKFDGIDKAVGNLEQKNDYWGAACLCEGYISPVTALGREKYYSPLNVEPASRGQFAQRAIDNYLRSAPKDVKGAVRIAFHVFGEPGALEICKRYSFDFNSAVDAQELQMIDYHRELDVMAAEQFNPEAFRQLIAKNEGILQGEIVSRILQADNLRDLRNLYDQRINHHRAIYSVRSK